MSAFHAAPGTRLLIAYFPPDVPGVVRTTHFVVTGWVHVTGSMVMPLCATNPRVPATDSVRAVAHPDGTIEDLETGELHAHPEQFAQASHARLTWREKKREADRKSRVTVPPEPVATVEATAPAEPPPPEATAAMAELKAAGTIVVAEPPKKTRKAKAERPPPDAPAPEPAAEDDFSDLL
jgi:hypothetical protein